MARVGVLPLRRDAYLCQGEEGSTTAAG
jgi:hypothetical protein